MTILTGETPTLPGLLLVKHSIMCCSDSNAYRLYNTLHVRKQRKKREGNNNKAPASSLPCFAWRKGEMMNKLRIYVVITTFLPSIGGAEMQTLLQCQHLLQRGLTMQVV